jgi:NAD(P)-dependent dehydrogenase (short-subunit alcohol dehydrogenase family)
MESEGHRTPRVAVGGDLLDVNTLPALVQTLIAEHGVPAGLVHTTFASSAGKRLEALGAADFQKTFAQSLPPTFLLCRDIAEAMKPIGRGSIVLFSSMYGIIAPDPRVYHSPMTPNPIDYGASKAAVLQLSRYFAMHYGAAGIRFNCVTPGPFPNSTVQEQHPAFVHELSRKTLLNRVGQNSEIVGPTLFLLTDSASFVTGHSLVVDGGWTAW